MQAGRGKEPDLFTHLFLTEHHAAKHGSVDRSLKELVSLLVAAWVITALIAYTLSAVDQVFDLREGVG
jgi:uncharacterized protein (UPF0254 family)